MQLIQDRRTLHQIPELDRNLPETMDYLKNSLEPLGCRLFSPMEGALCAFFDFGCKDAIAFRADADALPITERNTCGYVSIHPGKMHACGHDGHMAIRKAFENSMAGNGFSLVEVVSTCNSGWKLSPVASNQWLAENMLPFYPLGDIKDVKLEETR